MPRINLNSPYEIVLSNGDFVFQTASGIRYGISFEPDTPIGECDTYQFIIKKIDDSRSSHDPNVEIAIIAIIDEFFRSNLNVLLYICDTSDHRESQRNRLFLAWFERHAEYGRFTIKTARAQVEDEEIYAAIIVENRNPKLQAITDEFESSAEMLAK